MDAGSWLCSQLTMDVHNFKLPSDNNDKFFNKSPYKLICSIWRKSLILVECFMFYYALITIKIINQISFIVLRSKQFYDQIHQNYWIISNKLSIIDIIQLPLQKYPFLIKIEIFFYYKHNLSNIYIRVAIFIILDKNVTNKISTTRNKNTKD